jgi:hypothetical protein
LPNDDGSFAAVAAALSLTDGASDQALGDLAVLRLGPPGSALSVRRADRLVFASTRAGLQTALDHPEPPAASRDARPGLYARLSPAGLQTLTSVPGRRLAEALQAARCRDAEGWATLDDETLSFDLTARLAPGPRGGARLDPAWLDCVPHWGVVAALAIAIDSRAESLDAAFGLFDRVEKADPARAGLAPIRTRVNLLAAAARVRPEVDFWPDLRGLTVAWLTDDEGKSVGAVVALHMADLAAAGRVAERVLPRLAASYVPGGKTADARAAGPIALGAIDGKPLVVGLRGKSVIVGWGDGVLSDALLAVDSAEWSSGSAIRAGWGTSIPQRAGAVWPGRIQGVAPPGSPLARALAQSPPIVWRGHADGEVSRDEVRWGGFRGLVKRWLDALPLEPPP